MKYQYLLVFLAIFSLMSCQSEQDRAQAAITELEKQLDAGPTTEKAQELLSAYQEYLAQFPDDADAAPRYLYRAAALEYRMNRFSAAIASLTQAIRGHYDSPHTSKVAAFLGDIYQDKLHNEANAATVYQALIRAFPDSEDAMKAKEKLPEGMASLEQRIQEMGSQMFNDSTSRIEYRVANNYINSTELYALLLPRSEEAPGMLYKGAEVCRTIRNFNKAMELYQQISEHFPDSEQAPKALFMQAFTLDYDLKQLEEARELYEKFIADYPNDDFADDAQVLLDNLGKDEEEIIRSFTEKEEKGEKGEEEKVQ